MSQQDIENLVAEIDRERAGLRRLLRSKDPKVLAKRPAPEAWSIVENVRHLLWAEQRHLGAFLPDGFEWNRVGLTQFRGREFADVGTRPTRDITTVFAEWDKVHKPICRAVKSARGDIHKALRGNHKHLVHHISVIENLLHKFGA